MTHSLRRLFSSAVRRIRRPAPLNYRIEGVTLALPPNHPLPHLQRQYDCYDRFLPQLARALSPGDLVVDVGANCGDTMAALVTANPGLHLICVEPNSEFFAYLGANRTALLTVHPHASVTLIPAMVGDRVKSAQLISHEGTATALPTASAAPAPGTDAHQSRRLDEILQEMNLSGRRLRLLKSDVDGFDWDVIESAGALLTRDQPLLFFECQTDTESQLAAFREFLRRLIDDGYLLHMFDNFGEYVLAVANSTAAFELLEYTWRQQRRAGHRAIFYFDVLAAPPRDQALVAQVLAAYKALS